MSRISFITRFEHPKRNLMQNTSKIQDSMERISTGKKISRPSDNPPDLVRLFNFHNEQARIEQYNDNISSGKNELESAESTLGEVTDLSQRIRELAVQAANDSLGAEERKLIASEVDERLEELLDVSNNKLGGSFLFGGTETEGRDRIFVAERNGEGQIVDVNYHGDYNHRRKQTGDGAHVPTNLPGHEVFQASNQKVTGGLTFADQNAVTTNTISDTTSVKKGYFEIDGEEFYYDTGSETLQDVAQKINSRGISVEARIKANSDVTGVNPANNEFVISGDHTGNFDKGDKFVVDGSSVNDGEYTVQSTSLSGGDTVISVREGVSDPPPAAAGTGQVETDYDPASVGANHTNYQLKLRSRVPHKIYMRDVDRDPDTSEVDGLLNDLEVLGDGTGDPPAPKDAQNFPVSHHSNAELDGKTLFDAIVDFRETLEGNPPSGDQKEGLQQAMEDIQKGVDNLLVHRSIGGARLNRLESAKSRNKDRSLHTKELISSLEDANLAEVISQYERRQAVQQASLRMASDVMKMSLANHI